MKLWVKRKKRKLGEGESMMHPIASTENAQGDSTDLVSAVFYPKG